MTQQPPAGPDALTRLIGKRVSELRDERGMSQTALGDRMADLGVEWSRTTVAKLEAGKRASVSVSELLALALVFDSAPALLIADPRTGQPVPVPPGRQLDPWDALMWIAGAGAGKEPRLVEAALRVEEALLELQDPGPAFDLHRAAARSGTEPSQAALERAHRYDEDRHRQALLNLRIGLAAIQRAGASIPSTIDREAVLRRADELGVADEYHLNAILRDGQVIT